MRIRIDDIKDEGLTLDFAEEATAFPELAEVSAAGDCEFTAPVKTRLRAFQVRGMVEVEGQVETTLRQSCSRCLEEYEETLSAPFALTYTRELPEVEEDSGDEVEISAEEMGLILFEGEEIDLREAVQEQVIMGLPLQPLCRRECKGLCPQCGANLNEGECGCGSPDFSIKFAALKGFKVDKDKSK
jgi:uncharacterized protein